MKATKLHQEIKEFCTLTYGVTFPVMSKISVKGDNINEVYQWLTQEKLNGFQDSSVKWNFQKYLINSNGTIAKVISPKTDLQVHAALCWVLKTASVTWNWPEDWW